MKKTTRLLLSVSTLVFIASTQLFAQFTQVWMQQYRHTPAINYSSESRKVVQDALGFIYVMTDNTSDLDSNSMQSTQAHHYTVISKYAPNGNKLHRKVIEVFNHVSNGFDNLGAFGLEVDASCNIYVGYTPYSVAGSYNVAVMKLDSSLTNVLWNSQYGTSTSDVGIDMKLGTGGTVYFVAKTTNGGTTTYSVLKTNSGTAPTLMYSFSPNTDVISSMALGANDDVYVTGYRMTGGNKTLLMAGIDHLLFFPKWIQTYNGGFAGDDFGNMVTVGADGNVYFVGTSAQNPLRGNDIVIIKHSASALTKAAWISLQNYGLDDSGKLISVPELDYAYVGGVSGKNVLLYRMNVASLPPPMSPGIYKPEPITAHTTLSNLNLTAMKVSSTKKVYITGSIEATDLSGHAFSAMFLAKYYLVFGNVLSLSYESACRGSYTENLKGIGLSLDYGKSDVYVLGDFWNNNQNHQEEYSQLYDMDVSSPLRESSSIQESVEVRVYPNPAHDYIMVNANTPVLGMQITDLTGQLVRSVDAVQNNSSISIGDLPKGIYMCRMVLENNLIKYQRLLVE